MNNLVIMKNKQAVTSSLQVAETFEKQHKHVLEAIESKIHSAENSAQLQSMFVAGTYKDKSGKANKMYYMNRDGWTFIAMGFTGAKADAFKLKYIQAFNSMETAIKNSKLDSYMIPDPIQRADRWKQEYLERKQLAEENQQLQAPALLGTAVSGSDGTITVGSFAKVLKQNGVDIGQNRLFKWLRDHNYLIDRGRHNAPTQRSMNQKLMQVSERVVYTNHGAVNKFTPLITGKGQQYFINKFLKEAVKEASK